jgi:MoaA/NifB/PqqE/SkfB family radical SAM enzyme
MQKLFSVFKTLITRRLVIVFDKIEFTYTDLSLKRIFTWFASELCCLLKTDRVFSYPTHIQVEPSSICNLRCPLCHVVTEHKTGGFLSLERFKKIIDEIGDYSMFLHFWGWGEPFMNKEIFSMIRYAKGKGLKIISSTNGHFFDSEENIDRLIDSGLDALIFALDGVDQQTYEKYRKQGDFQKAIQGLSRLLARRNSCGAKTPLVNLRMLVMRDNEGQIEQMRDLARNIGVDVFTIKTLCSFDNETSAKTMLPCNMEYRRFEYDQAGNPIRKENPCKKFWNHPTVYINGEVVPCDYHNTQERVLGNAFADINKGFARVWFGREFRKLRSDFTLKRRTGLRCDKCSLNYADVDRCASHAFYFNKSAAK